MSIFLKEVRLSFPHLVQPHSAGPNASPAYSADFIMEANSENFRTIRQAAMQVATEKWQDKAASVMQYATQDSKLRTFGDGNLKIKQATMQPYEGYAGLAYVGARNTQQPQIIGANGQPVDNPIEIGQEAQKLYGGCYVNAAIAPWVQDNAHGRTVRWNLIAVQFARDGDPFGEGTPDASHLFGAVSQPQAQTAEESNPFANPFTQKH